MGLIGPVNPIESRGPARTKVNYGTGSAALTQWLDGSPRSSVNNSWQQQAPFPETTIQFGVQWQAAPGLSQWLRSVNGTLCSSTHGPIIPHDFYVTWLSVRVNGVAAQYGYDVNLYNNGSLTFSVTLNNGNYEISTGHDGTHTPFDEGNISVHMNNVTASGGSAFTNPLVSLGIRRRF